VGSAFAGCRAHPTLRPIRGDDCNRGASKLFLYQLGCSHERGARIARVQQVQAELQLILPPLSRAVATRHL
jgi:hypothetical protein